ncbi:hypothetical protein B0H13DRAFT_2355764 [Mycena leptocephala]|nr:hypothetical protein B0H13DRAFT_2355764 [Mycena leptocephala]
MDLRPFTFTFQVASESPGPSATPTTSSSTLFLPSATEAAQTSGPHAVASAKYRAKNREVENEKARVRMRKRREQKPATVPADPEAVIRRQESSEKLRASKSFAEFRELVRQTMFWVSIDDKDPEQLAAYEQFLANCNASLTGASDDVVGRGKHGSTSCCYEGHATGGTARTRRARSAAREKYRAQHRLLLSHKERERREAKSRASHTLDEFIRRRRTRQAKADQRRPTRQSDPTEPDELID